MPNTKVACDAVNSHLFVGETIVSQLFEVFIDCLFDDGFAFVTSQIFNFNYVNHFVVLIGNHYIRLYPLSKLFDCFFTVNFEIAYIKFEFGFLSKSSSIKLLNEGEI